MDEVKGRVDAITTFPSETERPRVFIPESGNYIPVLTVAVTGRLNPVELRRLARRVQDELLELPGLSRASLDGSRRYEIGVEASLEKLRSYGLSFQDLADAIRRFSIDLPAGSIESRSGTLIVRTRGQAYTGEDFAKIPLRSANGSEVLLGEVATLHDGFEEDVKRVEFNGRPALFIQVMRTGQESAIAISDRVHEYVKASKQRFPEGIDLFLWSDESKAIRERLSTLTSNMAQGALLVLIVLGLFLQPRLAFWIVWGIPVAFCGSLILMPWLGVTANVMSLFGYILVLGMVVDDAIVTGENVYSKMKAGASPLDAAIEGTEEVAVPVTFGVLTTVIAFLPMFLFEGTWGDYARQIPPVVIPVLLFSLLESKLCLPAHLKHLRTTPGTHAFARFQGRIAAGLERFVDGVYKPLLVRAVAHRATVICSFFTLALLMAGWIAGGRLKFVSFPSVDTMRITAILDLPDDTPLEVTSRYMDRLQAALEPLRQEFKDPGTGESLIRNVALVAGGYGAGGGFDRSRGSISVEIMDPGDRTTPGPRNSQIAKRWTELVGEIPEAVTFRVIAERSLEAGREYADENLHLELRGPTSPRKAEVAEQIKALLQSQPGIKTAWAQINYGQDELELSLRPRAAELGLTQALLARQIRQAFFGEEAQRVQRGVDDLRVMVRLPRADRETLHTLDGMKIRTPRGTEVPLAAVAEVRFTKAPSFVERNDRAEVIRIGAQPADETVDILSLARTLEPRLRELCLAAGDLSFEFKGQVAEAVGARRRTLLGMGALLLALYAMLAIPFRSLVQPLFVMLAIPFAILGALLGHILLGVTPSYLSVFGMLALAGVAVNDSIVLMDYINQRRAEGRSLREAALEAGARRFRPILLTSGTTFAGLAPLMIAKSLQAQFLIPMAISLGFGILFGTAITLFLVPCVLIVAEDLRNGWRRTWARLNAA
jgi:multidrug efflux pump subunit AcrB